MSHDEVGKRKLWLLGMYRWSLKLSDSLKSFFWNVHLVNLCVRTCHPLKLTTSFWHWHSNLGIGISVVSSSLCINIFVCEDASTLAEGIDNTPRGLRWIDLKGNHDADAGLLAIFNLGHTFSRACQNVDLTLSKLMRCLFIIYLLYWDIYSFLLHLHL